MNVKLLRRIIKAIKKEPGQFDMRSWFTRQRGIPNCGTAACIGGWAVALTKRANPEKARLASKNSRERTKEAVTKAVARINHFIKTKGAE